MHYSYYASAMLTNINYRGKVVRGIQALEFRERPPQMSVASFSHKGNALKLVAFRNGKCRIMGCRTPIETHSILKLRAKGCDLYVRIGDVMSASATLDVGHKVNLRSLVNFCMENDHKFLFEPELFPALRLTQFNPLCINVFGSGNCVLLGIRNLTSFPGYAEDIIRFINSSGATYNDDDDDEK